ncbi:MAG: branched-chain-amino-acid transaminase [Actinobacteria bacterium RBG_16_64_13]|nr:MAG: branched-chain-amino-acid transaminase [Actinobacteria bacterium RBG_16_64_13]
MQIYIDGEFYSKEDAKVSVFDHGLLYGDGVFEGIRNYGGRVFELDPHIDRLYASAKVIALEIPLSREELVEAMMETIRRNEGENDYIRLVVTRGVGDLGLNPSKCPKATVFCIVGNITLYPAEVYERGFKVKTLSTRRNDPQAVNPAIKSLNYLNNVMGSLELRGVDVNEGLFLTTSGYVCECTADNVFLIKGNKLMTPSPALGALPGITRAVVMRLAAGVGMELEEGFYTLYDVYNADEAFLTGTAAEVGPVVELDRRPIGAGVPGPITKDIITRFHDYAKNTGTPVYK